MANVFDPKQDAEALEPVATRVAVAAVKALLDGLPAITDRLTTDSRAQTKELLDEVLGEYKMVISFEKK